jgi:polyribonucleotide nucleotidyltransferase
MIKKLQIEKKEMNFDWNNKKLKFQTGFLAPQAE